METGVNYEELRGKIDKNKSETLKLFNTNNIQGDFPDIVKRDSGITDAEYTKQFKEYKSAILDFNDFNRENNPQNSIKILADDVKNHIFPSKII